METSCYTRLEAVMKELNNFFEYAVVEGTFAIRDGVLTHDALPVTGLAAITGSVFNDGVHRLGVDVLTDETFAGRVWLLHPPKAFLDLCAEVADYDAKNPAGSPVSESFGPYSHSRATSAGGGVQTWQEAYGRRLAPYRHMFTEVDL